MGPPPAKKQRRLIIRSLNEEDDEDGKPRTRNVYEPGSLLETERSDNKPTSLPNRSRSKPKALLQNGDSASSRGSTPTVSPNKPKQPASKPGKSGTLYTFFNTAAQSQRANGSSRSTKRSIEVEEEDVIEDDISDNEQQNLSQKHTLALKTESRQKRFRNDSTGCLTGDITPSEGSQKFKQSSQPQRSHQHQVDPSITDGRKPWAEMFAPSTPDELAVHKRKVADVRTWLDNVLKGRDRKRLLILKGPSGTGKTATISTLAKYMDFDVVEWKNPAGSGILFEGFLSLTAQFEDFLERSGKFSSLTLEDSSGAAVAKQAHHASQPPGDRRRVILLEEFPNTFSTTSNTLSSFRLSVLQYLAANTPLAGAFFTRQHEDQTDITPVIMVISETLLTTTTAAADTFTAHRLFGREILNHPRTTVIEFNPIAPTFLNKALELVIQKEARLSGRRRTPGPAVLKKLGEVGDIRSAIGSLEFMCVRNDNGSDWGGRVAAKGKKGAKDSSDLTEMEKESIEMVTQREASLGIFHAVGKVVYNKRQDVSASDPHIEPPVQPPDHLLHYDRPKLSVVNVDDLMDETGTDTPTFIAALHENFALSCDGPTSMDALNGCLDVLSDSDLLSSDRRNGFSNREGSGYRVYQGSDTEALRQNEICFNVAVRGLVFALPYPVKRRVIPANGSRGGGKGDAFKMFYPTSMRLWKQAEEIEGLIDRWSDPSLYQPSSQAGKHEAEGGGVEMWGNKSFSMTPGIFPSTAIDDTLPTRLTVRKSSRLEMILERLPYIAKVEHRRFNDPLRMRELETMTQFHGIVAPTDNIPDEYDQADGRRTAIAVTKLSDSHTQHTGSRGESGKGNGGLHSAPPVTLENSVIVDDDIEDD